ncbi:hypothetical protein BJF82_12265 [Kytococcus sp. CUA-901]|nr:hypothetical protein BJF82_12265 [Kytococcus sp. CUA-901]
MRGGGGGATRGGAAFGDGAGGPYDHADDITLDVLYGSYLHGDYDKWARSRARPQLYEEMALWSWVTNVEAIIYDLQRSILDVRDEGTIILPDGPGA